MIGISACLGGVSCRYDGREQTIPTLKKLVTEGQAIVICPEVAGGLPIPREPAEIVGGDGFDVWDHQAKVMTISGKDVTEAYKNGAINAYQVLKEKQISTLILKANSPSCGSSTIYDGSFTGSLKEGIGVATAYFLQQKISVCSEEEWMDQRGELNGN